MFSNEPLTYDHCENHCCSQSHVPGRSTYSQWWVLRERCVGGAAALAVGALSLSLGHRKGATGSGGGALARTWVLDESGRCSVKSLSYRMPCTVPMQGVVSWCESTVHYLLVRTALEFPFLDLSFFVKYFGYERERSQNLGLRAETLQIVHFTTMPSSRCFPGRFNIMITLNLLL